MFSISKMEMFRRKLSNKIILWILSACGIICIAQRTAVPKVSYLNNSYLFLRFSIATCKTGRLICS